MPLSQPLNSTVPAGWYKDPLGLPQLRWWNGTKWTTDVSEPRPELLVAGGLGSVTNIR
jgi:hypothetical protein